ncbi:MAG: serine/threonine protein kinase, partial [Myxococcales bacterium]|nr:serine/threonine protein kinase [Myxococcales bacterium]
PSLALDVLRPMMDALALAHEHGIVHRDLKPDNIYVSRDGDGMMVPKLLDFGIAKIAETEGSAATHTGALVGTPRYMSPEQVDASVDVGPAADIWSIGVVLFECLAGRPPFEQPTAPSLFVAIMSTEPPALNEVAPDVPAAIAACVDRALSRAPSDRWPSMRAFLVALDAAALEA